MPLVPCAECGREISTSALACPGCGYSAIPLAQSAPLPVKSRQTAMVLALFLGGLGAHKFYLGRTGQAVLYVLFCWTGFPFVIGFLEAASYLSMTDERFAREYGLRPPEVMAASQPERPVFSLAGGKRLAWGAGLLLVGFILSFVQPLWPTYVILAGIALAFRPRGFAGAFLAFWGASILAIPGMLRTLPESGTAGGKPAPVTAAQPRETFTSALARGADCPTLFGLRNEAKRAGATTPQQEQMNDKLRSVGCYSDTSQRRAPKPAKIASFTVREYRVYRFIVYTESLSEDEAAREAGRRFGMTPKAAMATAKRVQEEMMNKSLWSVPEQEIRHASDWNGEKP